jgi:hypothetical protein
VIIRANLKLKHVGDHYEVPYWIYSQ